MIHWDTFKLFKKYIPNNSKVIELGDQLMDIGHDTRYMRSDEYFKRDGIETTSVDWHGNNRALKLNLSQPIETDFKADYLTDFGTIEHVESLYHALLNSHNFMNVGGIAIHSNPKTGTFPGHGNHFFTQEFWIELCKLTGYELIEVGEHHPYDISNTDIEVYCVLKKTKEEFISEKEFKKLKAFYFQA